jgi:hypothetical protein
MPRIRFMLPSLLLLSTSLLIAGGKKPALPAIVVNAKTALVLIDPHAGTSMADPLENKKAQDDVEKALTKWGRIRPVMDGTTADLVIVVRKGSKHPVEPTIGGLPTNDRPVIVQQTPNSTRVGGQAGKNPGIPQSDSGVGPGPQMEVAPPEDIFSVYLGQVVSPTDSAPVWRYVRKDALKSPNVPAVDEFRKAVEDAEKQIQQQQKKP